MTGNDHVQLGQKDRYKNLYLEEVEFKNNKKHCRIRRFEKIT